MGKLLLPWKSDVLLQYPYALAIFIYILAVLLSIITWVRKKRVNRNRK